MIQHKKKANTIKCYVSAIKAVLRDVGRTLHEDTALLAALTRASRIQNDVLHSRLPIRKAMLTMLINSIESFFGDSPQPYLSKLYAAMLATTYFGLFCLGKVSQTQMDHVVKAKDVHIGHNKNKLMFVLHSSKTHGKCDKPQIIKISQVDEKQNAAASGERICPFALLKTYLQVRGKYKSASEQFFVYSDKSPVSAIQFSVFLKRLINFNHLDSNRYSVTSLRSGRASDLLAMGITVIKQ